MVRPSITVFIGVGLRRLSGLALGWLSAMESLTFFNLAKDGLIDIAFLVQSVRFLDRQVAEVQRLFETIARLRRRKCPGCAGHGRSSMSVTLAFRIEAALLLVQSIRVPK